MNAVPVFRTKVQELAEFVVRATFEAIPEAALRELKIRMLDSLGCAIGALRAEPIGMIRAYLRDMGGRRHCTLIGGGKTAPDRAAFYNGALVRYLDFMDSYLAKGETCHPCDNVGAVLAAAEYANGTGRDLLTALAVAYQVQCRLSDEAPVRHRGFDHTTQGSYSVAAGVSKALGLDEERTANAIAISGTAFNALRVTRTGKLSHWKGLAFPNTAFGGTHAAFLAMRGITGPAEVFEGNKGFMDAIAGRFEIDWSGEGLDRVTRTIVKKYNAEIHSQSAIEGLLELRAEHGFTAREIASIEIEIFDVAYNIIGGGEEGEKKQVTTKEEADHSLPYMIAVAAIDGEVTPKQYLQRRIVRRDVQSLLRRVTVRPNEGYSRRFPEELPCRLTVHLTGGRTLTREKSDYEGFHSRPMPWQRVVEKFSALCPPSMDEGLREGIIDAVAGLESLRVAELVELLAKCCVSSR
jgi:2-methylcitrate dehydratase